jgi:hypothetical protein
MNSIAPVGEILIGSPDKKLAYEVFEYLGSWLEKENWSKSVSVQIAIGQHVPKQDRVEILLEPGEYQSNNRKKLIYVGTPILANIEKAIRQWLYEVES